jgi:hypothetical protein
VLRRSGRRPSGGPRRQVSPGRVCATRAGLTRPWWSAHAEPHDPVGTGGFGGGEVAPPAGALGDFDAEVLAGLVGYRLECLYDDAGQVSGGAVVFDDAAEPQCRSALAGGGGEHVVGGCGVSPGPGGCERRGPGRAVDVRECLEQRVSGCLVVGGGDAVFAVVAAEIGEAAGELVAVLEALEQPDQGVGEGGPSAVGVEGEQCAQSRSLCEQRGVELVGQLRSLVLDAGPASFHQVQQRGVQCVDAAVAACPWAASAAAAGRVRVRGLVLSLRCRGCCGCCGGALHQRLPG